jgi:hypothetical protein
MECAVFDSRAHFFAIAALVFHRVRDAVLAMVWQP